MNPEVIDTTAAPAATTSTPAETTPAATTPPAVLNPDGTFAENWHGQLGDEFAGYGEQLAPFKDVKGLAKSYLHFRKTGPAYPGEDATPADVERFRELAQVPKTADGYGIVKPETLPEGVEWSDETTGKFLELAHKHHIPAPAMKALVAAQLELEGARAAAARDAAAAAEKQAQDALVADWRGNFEQNASQVRHLTEKLAEGAGISPDDPKIPQLANDPAFAKIMLQVAKLTSEDRVRTPAGLGDLRTPQQRAREIMQNQDPVWGEKYANGDPEAMKLVSSLLEKADT